jgi:hypothetical protein
VTFVFVLPIIVKANAALPVEEVHVTEVTRVVTRVKLLGPESDPVVGLRAKGRSSRRSRGDASCHGARVPRTAPAHAGS